MVEDQMSPSSSIQECPRVNILGVGVSVLDMDDAVRRTNALLQADGKGYVCVTGVHGIIEAQSDPGYRAILNESFLTTPDGTPTVWIGRIGGWKNMRRVYGPEYMLRICELSAQRGYRNFLYGGNEGVAQTLGEMLKEKVPGLQMVGHYTPPFRPLNEAEESELTDLIAKSKPDILWVGLSTPKQERFMAKYLPRLDVRLMVGVGAAFDVHTGGIKDAPKWMKDSGTQWLHRLIQEPRRLWRRYLINNPVFAWHVFLQLANIRKYII